MHKRLRPSDVRAPWIQRHRRRVYCSWKLSLLPRHDDYFVDDYRRSRSTEVDGLGLAGTHYILPLTGHIQCSGHGTFNPYTKAAFCHSGSRCFVYCNRCFRHWMATTTLANSDGDLSFACSSQGCGDLGGGMGHHECSSYVLVAYLVQQSWLLDLCCLRSD